MEIEPGRVVVGMLRLDRPEPGQWERAARWVTPREAGGLGLAGLLVFGGEWPVLGERLRALERRAGRRLLLSADYERGAGQQVAGLCELPHLMALGATDDPALCRRAARATARQARALGIRLVFAPCLDLATAPGNPIIDVRAFGDDPERCAHLGRVWIEAAQAEGVLACAKHWPGHGDVEIDSHIARPLLEHGAQALAVREFVPFAAAFEAQVASVMTAHLAAPALTGDGRACVTVCASALARLRAQAGGRTLIVSDALLMGGLVEDGDEEAGGLAALAAGCDVLLAPSDPERLCARLAHALDRGELAPGRVAQAAERIAWQLGRSAWAAGAPAPAPGELEQLAEQAQALASEIARKALVRVRGQAPPAFARRGGLVVSIAGDADEVHAPFAARLCERAPQVRLLPVHTASPEARLEQVAQALGQAHGRGMPVAIVLGSSVRAWKAHTGLPERERALLARLLAIAPEASVLALGSPRLLVGAQGARGFLGAALSDVPASQWALADALATGGPFPGKLPLTGTR